jgi:LysR family glycine cleavage system transcriptional activator
VNDPLDHLNALRCFEAVARLGSVRSAAVELSVTTGAVSKQLRNLENAFGVELFIRGHRKLILTEEAASLAQSLRGAFEVIVRSAEQTLRSSRANGLTIAAPGTFLVRWLLPRLGKLEDRLNGTAITLVDWKKDLIATDRSIDIHIAVGKFDGLPGMTCEHLAAETHGPVIRRADAPAAPLDVLNNRRLGTSWPKAMWRNWSSESGNPLPDQPVMMFERLLLALEAAEAGLGVALAPGPQVWDAVAAGKLAAPLGFLERDGSWSMMWRTDQTSGLHMSALRWFQKEFAASQSAALAVCEQ